MMTRRGDNTMNYVMMIRSMIRVLLSALIYVLLPLAGAAYAQRQAPQGPVGDRRNAGNDTAAVLRFEYIERDSSVTLDHARLLEAPPTGDKGAEDSLVRIGNTSPAYCANRVLHAAWFKVVLDRGEDYEYGDSAFTISVTLKITGIDTNGASVISYQPVVLETDEDAPEQVFRIVYKGADLATYGSLQKYVIQVDNYTTSASVTGDVRLTATFHEEYAIGPKDLNHPDEPLLELDPIHGPVTGNPIYFAWDVVSGCADTFPNYQIQVLRLYNLDTSYNEDDHVRAVVDWDQA